MKFPSGPNRWTTSLFCGVVFVVSARAAEFTRSSSFDSVNAFVAAMKAFNPAESKTELGHLFTIAEMDESEDPKSARPVTPHTVDSCEDIYDGATHALVFALATPKTEATRSSVGVLFLLSCSHHRWIISDLHRFTATGKYAAVNCELTADAGIGYHLGEEGMRPIVTVKEFQGGRGYGYVLSASYSFSGNRLQRIDLE